MIGRARQELELVDRSRALTMGGAKAVRTGVAAADDRDTLACSRDLSVGLDEFSFTAAVLLREVIDSEMDALQLASRDRKIARLCRPGGKHHCVELASQLGHLHVHADVLTRAKLDALVGHQGQPAIEEPFLELEFGDSVAQKPA